MKRALLLVSQLLIVLKADQQIPRDLKCNPNHLYGSVGTESSSRDRWLLVQVGQPTLESCIQACFEYRYCYSVRYDPAHFRPCGFYLHVSENCDQKPLKKAKEIKETGNIIIVECLKCADRKDEGQEFGVNYIKRQNRAGTTIAFSLDSEDRAKSITTPSPPNSFDEILECGGKLEYQISRVNSEVLSSTTVSTMVGSASACASSCLSTLGCSTAIYISEDGVCLLSKRTNVNECDNQLAEETIEKNIPIQLNCIRCVKSVSVKEKANDSPLSEDFSVLDQQIYKRSCLVTYQAYSNPKELGFEPDREASVNSVNECAFICYQNSCSGAIFEPPQGSALGGKCKVAIRKKEKCDASLQRHYSFKTKRAVGLSCFRCVHERPITVSPGAKLITSTITSLMPPGDSENPNENSADFQDSIHLVHLSKGCTIHFQVDRLHLRPFKSEFEETIDAETADICATRCYQNGCTGSLFNAEKKECKLGYEDTHVCSYGPLITHFVPMNSAEDIWIHCVSCQTMVPRKNSLFSQTGTTGKLEISTTTIESIIKDSGLENGEDKTSTTTFVTLTPDQEKENTVQPQDIELNGSTKSVKESEASSPASLEKIEDVKMGAPTIELEEQHTTIETILETNNYRQGGTTPEYHVEMTTSEPHTTQESTASYTSVEEKKTGTGFAHDLESVTVTVEYTVGNTAENHQSTSTTQRPKSVGVVLPSKKGSIEDEEKGSEEEEIKKEEAEPNEDEVPKKSKNKDDVESGTQKSEPGHKVAFITEGPNHENSETTEFEGDEAIVSFATTPKGSDVHRGLSGDDKYASTTWLPATLSGLEEVTTTENLTVLSFEVTTGYTPLTIEKEVTTTTERTSTVPVETLMPEQTEEVQTTAEKPTNTFEDVTAMATSTKEIIDSTSKLPEISTNETQIILNNESTKDEVKATTSSHTPKTEAETPSPPEGDNLEDHNENITTKTVEATEQVEEKTATDLTTKTSTEKESPRETTVMSIMERTQSSHTDVTAENQLQTTDATDEPSTVTTEIVEASAATKEGLGDEGVEATTKAKPSKQLISEDTAQKVTAGPLNSQHESEPSQTTEGLVIKTTKWTEKTTDVKETTVRSEELEETTIQARVQTSTKENVEEVQLIVSDVNNRDTTTHRANEDTTIFGVTERNVESTLSDKENVDGKSETTSGTKDATTTEVGIERTTPKTGESSPSIPLDGITTVAGNTEPSIGTNDDAISDDFTRKPTTTKVKPIESTTKSEEETTVKTPNDEVAGSMEPTEHIDGETTIQEVESTTFLKGKEVTVSAQVTANENLKPSKTTVMEINTTTESEFTLEKSTTTTKMEEAISYSKDATELLTTSAPLKTTVETTRDAESGVTAETVIVSNGVTVKVVEETTMSKDGITNLSLEVTTSSIVGKPEIAIEEAAVETLGHSTPEADVVATSTTKFEGSTEDITTIEDVEHTTKTPGEETTESNIQKEGLETTIQTNRGQKQPSTQVTTNENAEGLEVTTQNSDEKNTVDGTEVVITKGVEVETTTIYSSIGKSSTTGETTDKEEFEAVTSVEEHVTITPESQREETRMLEITTVGTNSERGTTESTKVGADVIGNTEETASTKLSEVTEENRKIEFSQDESTVLSEQNVDYTTPTMVLEENKSNSELTDNIPEASTQTLLETITSSNISIESVQSTMRLSHSTLKPERTTASSEEESATTLSSIITTVKGWFSSTEVPATSSIAESFEESTLISGESNTTKEVAELKNQQSLEKNQNVSSSTITKTTEEPGQPEASTESIASTEGTKVTEVAAARTTLPVQKSIESGKEPTTTDGEQTTASSEINKTTQTTNPSQMNTQTQTTVIMVTGKGEVTTLFPVDETSSAEFVVEELSGRNDTTTTKPGGSTTESGLTGITNQAKELNIPKQTTSQSSEPEEESKATTTLELTSQEEIQASTEHGLTALSESTSNTKTSKTETTKTVESTTIPTTALIDDQVEAATISGLREKGLNVDNTTKSMEKATRKTLGIEESTTSEPKKEETNTESDISSTSESFATNSPHAEEAAKAAAVSTTTENVDADASIVLNKTMQTEPFDDSEVSDVEPEIVATSTFISTTEPSGGSTVSESGPDEKIKGEAETTATQSDIDTLVSIGTTIEKVTEQPSEAEKKPTTPSTEDTEVTTGFESEAEYTQSNDLRTSVVGEVLTSASSADETIEAATRSGENTSEATNEINEKTTSSSVLETTTVNSVSSNTVKSAKNLTEENISRSTVESLTEESLQVTSSPSKEEETERNTDKLEAVTESIEFQSSHSPNTETTSKSSEFISTSEVIATGSPLPITRESSAEVQGPTAEFITKTTYSDQLSESVVTKTPEVHSTPETATTFAHEEIASAPSTPHIEAQEDQSVSSEHALETTNDSSTATPLVKIFEKITEVTNIETTVSTVPATDSTSNPLSLGNLSTVSTEELVTAILKEEQKGQSEAAQVHNASAAVAETQTVTTTGETITSVLTTNAPESGEIGSSKSSVGTPLVRVTTTSEEDTTITIHKETTRKPDGVETTTTTSGVTRNEELGSTTLEAEEDSGLTSAFSVEQSVKQEKIMEQSAKGINDTEVIFETTFVPDSVRSSTLEEPATSITKKAKQEIEEENKATSASNAVESTIEVTTFAYTSEVQTTESFKTESQTEDIAVTAQATTIAPEETMNTQREETVEVNTVSGSETKTEQVEFLESTTLDTEEHSEESTVQRLHETTSTNPLSTEHIIGDDKSVTEEFPTSTANPGLVVTETSATKDEKNENQTTGSSSSITQETVVETTTEVHPTGKNEVATTGLVEESSRAGIENSAGPMELYSTTEAQSSSETISENKAIIVPDESNNEERTTSTPELFQKTLEPSTDTTEWTSEKSSPTTHVPVSISASIKPIVFPAETLLNTSLSIQELEETITTPIFTSLKTTASTSEVEAITPEEGEGAETSSNTTEDNVVHTSSNSPEETTETSNVSGSPFKTEIHHNSEGEHEESEATTSTIGDESTVQTVTAVPHEKTTYSVEGAFVIGEGKESEEVLKTTESEHDEVGTTESAIQTFSGISYTPGLERVNSKELLAESKVNTEVAVATESATKGDEEVTTQEPINGTGEQGTSNATTVVSITIAEEKVAIKLDEQVQGQEQKHTIEETTQKAEVSTETKEHETTELVTGTPTTKAEKEENETKPGSKMKTETQEVTVTSKITEATTLSSGSPEDRATATLQIEGQEDSRISEIPSEASTLSTGIEIIPSGKENETTVEPVEQPRDLTTPGKLTTEVLEGTTAIPENLTSKAQPNKAESFTESSTVLVSSELVTTAQWEDTTQVPIESTSREEDTSAKGGATSENGTTSSIKADTGLTSPTTPTTYNTSIPFATEVSEATTAASSNKIEFETTAKPEVTTASVETTTILEEILTGTTASQPFNPTTVGNIEESHLHINGTGLQATETKENSVTFLPSTVVPEELTQAGVVENSETPESSSTTMQTPTIIVFNKTNILEIAKPEFSTESSVQAITESVESTTGDSSIVKAVSELIDILSTQETTLEPPVQAVSELVESLSHNKDVEAIIKDHPSPPCNDNGIFFSAKPLEDYSQTFELVLASNSIRTCVKSCLELKCTKAAFTRFPRSACLLHFENGNPLPSKCDSAKLQHTWRLTKYDEVVDITCIQCGENRQNDDAVKEDATFKDLELPQVVKRQGFSDKCNGRVEFKLVGVNKLPKLNVTNDIAADTPADCAKKCLETEGCTTAGFVPISNTQTGLGVCLTTIDRTGCFETLDYTPQHASAVPFVISCIRCTKCDYHLTELTSTNHATSFDKTTTTTTVSECAEYCNQNKCKSAEFDPTSSTCSLSLNPSEALKCPRNEIALEVNGIFPVRLDCVKCF